MRWSVLVAALGFVSTGGALHSGWAATRMRLQSLQSFEQGDDDPAIGTLAYFDQLIDHQRPELGTFKQRYWYNTLYYKGPGSPVAFEAPGEFALYTEYTDLSNATSTGYIAQEIGGAAIQIEHRFFGESTPVPATNFNTETLQPHTLENAIADLVYFARNVKLPFDPHGLSHPDRAPWTISGCSYSGALAAWTQAIAPGTFWAAEAGSAVIEALGDFWQYNIPVEAAMSRNCSADFRRVMDHVDHVYINGTGAEKAELKKLFGHEALTDIDSVYNLTRWQNFWQGQQFFLNYGPFFRACDYIENQHPGSNEPMPGADGVGLEKALKGLAGAIRVTPTLRGGGGGDGIDPWSWLICNEPFKWFFIDRPNRPFGITSRLITRDFAINDKCGSMAEVGGYKVGIKTGKTEHGVNKYTGGWRNVHTKRMFFVNGELDPWLYATVSSPIRQGGPLEGTTDTPVHVLQGAAHCTDYYTENMQHNEGSRKMFEQMSASMKKWVAEFYEQHNITRP